MILAARITLTQRSKKKIRLDNSSQLGSVFGHRREPIASSRSRRSLDSHDLPVQQIDNLCGRARPCRRAYQGVGLLAGKTRLRDGACRGAEQESAERSRRRGRAALPCLDVRHGRREHDEAERSVATEYRLDHQCSVERHVWFGAERQLNSSPDK